MGGGGLVSGGSLSNKPPPGLIKKIQITSLSTACDGPTTDRDFFFELTPQHKVGKMGNASPYLCGYTALASQTSTGFCFVFLYMTSAVVGNGIWCFKFFFWDLDKSFHKSGWELAVLKHPRYNAGGAVAGESALVPSDKWALGSNNTPITNLTRFRDVKS